MTKFGHTINRSLFIVVKVIYTHILSLSPFTPLLGLSFDNISELMLKVTILAPSFDLGLRFFSLSPLALTVTFSCKGPDLWPGQVSLCVVQ